MDSTEALETVQQKLDAGLTDRLIWKYRDPAANAKDQWTKHEVEYQLIILGALIMATGVAIEDDDIQHLRQLASVVPCSETVQLALFDMGFRGPGKRQFLVALNNYKPRTPWNFHERSCHACGKTKNETAKALQVCGRCREAWFCEKVRLSRLRCDGC